MRRRIAAIVTVAGLLLGVAGALTPSSATTLCPPGCVLAGAVQAIGGFPTPTHLSLVGEITTVATTRTGETVPNTAAVGTKYYLSIEGDVSRAPRVTPDINLAGDPNHRADGYIGTVTFLAQRYLECDNCGTPDSFSGLVDVYQVYRHNVRTLRFSGNYIEGTVKEVAVFGQGWVGTALFRGYS